MLIRMGVVIFLTLVAGWNGWGAGLSPGTATTHTYEDEGGQNITIYFVSRVSKYKDGAAADNNDNNHSTKQRWLEL